MGSVYGCVEEGGYMAGYYKVSSDWLYTPYEGLNFGQSEDPEVGGIWSEVGG